MKIAFLGLGKLGMPVAVSLARLCPVTGFDVNPALMSKSHYPHRELGPDKKDPFQDWLRDADNLTFAGSVPEAVQGADLIFVAIQTPHAPEYEGATPLPSHRVDFDYHYLHHCAEILERCVTSSQMVIVISTVLPGTIRREVLPVLQHKCSVVYNPFFIAMGTVMHDFLHPEFVLLGGDDEEAKAVLSRFYRNYYDHLAWNEAGGPTVLRMSLESAELTKVAYNTFITSKIVYANLLMELCHKVGASVDSVTQALRMATDRLVSPKYLTAGMGDGGGCHPRDNIAMSYLARRVNLSFDYFEALMLARQAQAQWLVNLMCEHNLPKAIYGLSFKPETLITTGSPALLCAELLKQSGLEVRLFEPMVGDHIAETAVETKEASDHARAFGPQVILIGTRHACFHNFKFAPGSVVIDPHRYIPNQPDVRVIRVGELRGS